MSHQLNSGVSLVLGGARSGKSRFAEKLIEASGRDPVYIATAQAHDDEMSSRIATHRERRGGNWRTVEAPLDLAGALVAEDGEGRALLVDCLTLWLTNLIMAEVDIGAEMNKLIKALSDISAPVVFVSNEVGLGIVPENEMARAFRDHAGRLNQEIAALANTVWFIAAGLPMALKSAD